MCEIITRKKWGILGFYGLRGSPFVAMYALPARAITSVGDLMAIAGSFDILVR